MVSNALIIEAWRTVSLVGLPHRSYRFCLGLQALVVLVWWPEAVVLGGDGGPSALYAMMIALAITLSYQSIRIGAEELLFPGQLSLGDWLLTSRISLQQILSGYFVAHVIQTLHWLLLSLPILIIAWSVSGSNWHSLGHCLLTVFVISSGYRFTGACVFLLPGHDQRRTWPALRIILLLGFGVGGILLPTTSIWLISEAVLAPISPQNQFAAQPGFLLVYAVWLVVMMSAMAALAARLRSRAGNAGRLVSDNQQ